MHFARDFEQVYSTISILIASMIRGLGMQDSPFETGDLIQTEWTDEDMIVSTSELMLSFAEWVIVKSIPLEVKLLRASL
jgi:hypothetical protein